MLTSDARKRLKAVTKIIDLGSGMNIAMRDLDIRGAGNLLGGEQSGFISDIGYETFQRILAEAIQELKEKMGIPGTLPRILGKTGPMQADANRNRCGNAHSGRIFQNIQERLSLYIQLDALETEEEIDDFTKMLVDRFGKLPKQVKELFDGLRLRWHCRRLGFERGILKE